MAKKKLEPGMAYDTSKLNKIFFWLSLALLVSTVWMAMDDFIRPWKLTQLKAMKIEQGKVEAKLQAAQKEIDAGKVEELKSKIAEGKRLEAQRLEEIGRLEKEIASVDRDIKKETIINGTLNAQVSELNFNYEIAHSHHEDKKAKKLFAALKKNKKLFAESRNVLKTFESKKSALSKELGALRKESSSAEKELKKLTSKRDLLLKAKKAASMTSPEFFARNLPPLDFAGPTITINQVVLENITDDRFFQHVPKVDRCMTCHKFIDKPGYEKEENPFKTHPNLELMVGAKSTHPMKQFGCTTCHGGEGHRVNDFNSAAHIPANAEQKAEWEEKYHWHEPHKVPHVQFKKQYTEAGCLKCHGGVEYLPGATVLNEGKRNIEKFGCYACHKIKGWEHKRKPGPSLEKIAAKVDKEFFKKWVWDPKSFNKHAKMPSFFSQDNNSKPEFMAKNITEVNAMADFIYDISEPYKPFANYTGGSKKRGKQLVKEVGCMGCHGVEDFAADSKKIDAYAGPYLTGTGSKVNASWLVSWLLKPNHYQEDTIMPSFRLTNREANDIAAYLMGLKNEKFSKRKFESIDKKLRDELLVEYFSAFDTIEVAKAKLEGMTDHARTMELGKRSVGKYGCYSCHTIAGFEGRAPIGPELSQVGSKPLTQFGFAHEKVEHTRDGWIHAHLLNPRRWDNGIDKPFKDLLRMPNLNMTEKEATTITTYLLGNVSDFVPLKGVKRMNAEEAIVAEGMKVVHNYNCIGCHQIDGYAGDIMSMYEDDFNEGPPRLVDQGHRVQADWFHHFLANIYPIRPWLKVRMPSFDLTNEERNKIVAMFQAKSGQSTFEENHARVVWKKGEKAEAKRLFRALECTTCHTDGFNNDEAQAPDLHYVKRRLRPSWVKKWLEAPEKILEGTTMPNFWEDGEPTEPDYFGGDSKKQIEALTKYLLDMGYNSYSPKMRSAN